MSLEITLFAVIVTIILLATGWVMEYLALLIFSTLIMLLGISSASVTFSGFASAGFWLTFAGMPLNMGIKKTGLADRISLAMMRFFKGKYSVLVLGMVFFGTVMAFIMPSAMGRVVLMLPILIEFSRANGFLQGTKGYNGILLAGLLSTYFMGSVILPSNLPNLALMGSVKSLYHIDFVYANYLLLNFPVLGLLKCILLVFVIDYLFNDLPQKIEIEKEKMLMAFSGSEKRLVIYLLLLLAAWLSDSFTHLSPAWPALFVAVICLLPKIGILNHKNFIKESNLEPLFYVGGLIGLSAVVNDTGLGTYLGQHLIALLPMTPGHDAVNFYLLSLLSSVVGIVTTLPGVPAIVTPLATAIVKTIHLPLMTVLMTQTVGFSNFLLPYQAPPILIAMRLGNIPFKVVTQLCLIMAMISVFVLLPINYYWWKLLHVF